MKNKTALITGASAGIGRATAFELAEHGYRLILIARREDKLKVLRAELHSSNVHIIACDINDHEALDKQLAALPGAFKIVDVLINNAGLALGLDTADQANWHDWQTMVETNCLGLAYITRQILPSMVARNVGHIINIGSSAGTYAYKGANVYGATKAFVEQFSINLRCDLLGTPIRVCNVSPGMLGETEFSQVRFHGDKTAADAVYEGYQPLQPEDIASTISWVLAQPAHVNINQIDVMPTCQAPAGLALDKQV
jgi:3-hydroxy acid dehydrogenase/malonic semialdehyde reductase